MSDTSGIQIIHAINDAYTTRKMTAIPETSFKCDDVDGGVEWLKSQNVPVILSNHAKGRRLVVFNADYLKQVTSKKESEQ